MQGDPADLLERTLHALGAMECAELERLREEAEGILALPPEAAMTCARRAIALQESLDALLRSTEMSLKMLYAVRQREVSPWEH